MFVKGKWKICNIFSPPQELHETYLHSFFLRHLTLISSTLSSRSQLWWSEQSSSATEVSSSVSSACRQRSISPETDHGTYRPVGYLSKWPKWKDGSEENHLVGLTLWNGKSRAWPGKRQVYTRVASKVLVMDIAGYCNAWLHWYYRNDPEWLAWHWIWMHVVKERPWTLLLTLVAFLTLSLTYICSSAYTLLLPCQSLNFVLLSTLSAIYTSTVWGHSWSAPCLGY